MQFLGSLGSSCGYFICLLFIIRIYNVHFLSIFLFKVFVGVVQISSFSMSNVFKIFSQDDTYPSGWYISTLQDFHIIGVTYWGKTVTVWCDGAKPPEIWSRIRGGRWNIWRKIRLFCWRPWWIVVGNVLGNGRDFCGMASCQGQNQSFNGGEFPLKKSCNA